MEEVSQVDRKTLARTLQLMRAGSSFEDSLGKIVRREGMEYSDYIRLASLVREKAEREDIPLEKAMARLSRSDDEK